MQDFFHPQYDFFEIPRDSTGLPGAPWLPRHAAGIIDFVELKSQTAERMGKVFKPKAGSETGVERTPICTYMYI